MKIIVGSENPAKVLACKTACATLFPDQIIDVIGVSVESGVSDQPKDDDETMTGSLNRAKNAMKKATGDYCIKKSK